MHPSNSPLLVLRGLVCASLLATVAQADVHVVDASGGGDFTTIQAAVNAAADGDTLVVRAGSYAGFSLVGKGLAIVAEPGGAAPQVAAAIRVDGLPKGRTVVLSGLEVTATYTTDLTQVHALIVNQCAGSVRVQDCVLTGANNANDNQINFGDGSGGSGAFVVASQDVVFTRDTIVGGRGHQQYSCCDFGGTGGEGLHSISSIVALYDCSLTGGLGGYSGWGGNGGPALFAPDFGVFVAGSTLTGGKGGFGDDFIFGPGGTGGAGLGVGATAQAQLRGNALEGGAGGDSFLGQDGSPGPAIDATSGGAVVQLPGAARRFEFPDAGWEGSLVPLTVYGQPGDQVWFPGSSKPGFRFVPPLSGVWTTGLPVKLLAAPQGVVPSSGVLELLVPITDLSGEGDLRHFQGYVVSAFGQAYTGSPASFVRLGCAFSPDCDASGVPDACEIQSGAVSDCNHNGIPDSCDVAAGTLADCNLNGVADLCDIASGSSVDCDQNGVPDECQYDCNGNGIADVCDVQSGFSADCDGNLVPDECDVDCNANGVPDTCDIQLGTSFDVNSNGVPDECQSAGDVYLVDDDGPPYGADGSPAKPFDTLGKALAYAIDGNTILVADGTYAGPENRALDFAGRDLVVASQNGAAAVVVDCQGQDRAFVLGANTSLAARLEGLTIRNGDAFDASPDPGFGGAVLVRQGGGLTMVDCVVELSKAGYGGGVYVHPTADAWIEGSRLRDNTAVGGGTGAGGGGLSSSGSPSTGTLVLVDSEVTGNVAHVGAGVFSASGTTRIQDCLVDGNALNAANQFGGGIRHRGTGALEVVHTRVTGNSGGGNAAGIHSESTGSLLVSHCILDGNTSGSLGGAISVRNFGANALTTVVEDCRITSNAAGSGAGLNAVNVPSVQVRNCTFAFGASIQGGVAYLENVPSAVFRNCVVWDNTASFNGKNFHASNSTVDVDFCDVQGGLTSTVAVNGATFLWGTSNIDADPLFVDPDGPDGSFATWADNDYRLGPLSPCADAGDNAAVGPDVLDLDGDLDFLEPVPFDLDLLPRFEDDPAVPDTGAGTAPIVDLGAYERP